MQLPHPIELRKLLSLGRGPFDPLTHQFLKGILGICERDFSWKASNAWIAKDLKRSGRTARRRVAELVHTDDARVGKGRSAYGIAERVNNDGRVWTLQLRIDRLMQLLGMDAQRVQPVAAASRGGAPATKAPLKPPPPPPEPEPEPKAPQARRRRHRQREGEPSPVLSWIWNTSPNRSLGVELAENADEWPAELLERPLVEQAAIVDMYQQLCKHGGRLYHASAATIRKFVVHWQEVWQFAAHASMAQPQVGRARRVSHLPIQSDRALAPMAPRLKDQKDPESKALPDWLLARYLADGWPGDWWDLLYQEGDPPDWIPAALRRMWGTPAFLELLPTLG